nr:uncharacterized protein LOC127312489 [Lolium perenne]
MDIGGSTTQGKKINNALPTTKTAKKGTFNYHIHVTSISHHTGEKGLAKELFPQLSSKAYLEANEDRQATRRLQTKPCYKHSFPPGNHSRLLLSTLRCIIIPSYVMQPVVDNLAIL